MKTKYIILIFIVVAIVQLIVPINMIASKEIVLKTGTLYKFKTRPVDPTDLFRGKYIVLNYAVNQAKTKDSLWQRDEYVYVYIQTDSLGFAQVKQVSKNKLPINNDYIIANVRWYNKHEQLLHFNLPFNRFYMEESKAKPAEDAVRRAQRDSLPNTVYALVAVKDDETVLKDVMVNDISINDYVETIIEIQ